MYWNVMLLLPLCSCYCFFPISVRLPCWQFQIKNMFYEIDFQWRINERDKATLPHWLLLLLCERLKIGGKKCWLRQRIEKGYTNCISYYKASCEQNIRIVCAAGCRCTLLHWPNRNEFLMLLLLYKKEVWRAGFA